LALLPINSKELDGQVEVEVEVASYVTRYTLPISRVQSLENHLNGHVVEVEQPVCLFG